MRDFFGCLVFDPAKSGRTKNEDTNCDLLLPPCRFCNFIILVALMFTFVLINFGKFPLNILFHLKFPPKVYIEDWINKELGRNPRNLISFDYF